MTTTREYYWLDGSAYCPGCVECDTPAIDASNPHVQRGMAVRCSCCGADGVTMDNEENNSGCYSGSVGEVRRRVHMLRFALLDALPREDEESEGMQHCLLAHSLLSQVEYHLQLASMKGVR